jgi:hypothetical protein
MEIKFKAKVIELHPKELALIFSLRNKFKFGEVVVVMRDGVPQRLKQVVVFDDLSTVST